MTPNKIGRYHISSELGRGGMATVYQAHDPNFDRDVAIKVLPREFLHDPQFRERFEREAKTVAGLEHSAIVPVYDYGEEDGQLFLVMRYMPGGSLEERIQTGALLLKDTAAVMERLGRALDEAHQNGVIHRDLKPPNILFDQYGDPYLSDFGIAKLAEVGGSLTGTGIIGTPAYMSPEQARGDKDLDGRSDIYALGVIAFEMLTGEAPYESDTPMGVAVKHILDPVPEILEFNTELPADVDTVIKRALAKNREHRYITASDLSTALTAVAYGEPLPEELGIHPEAEFVADGSGTIPVAQPAPTVVVPSSEAPTAAVDMGAAPTQQAGGSTPTQAAPQLEQPTIIQQAPRRRGRWLLGCLLVVGLVTAVFFGTIIGMRSVVADILAGIPGIPPGILTQFDVEPVELTGNRTTHEIYQPLDGIGELDVRIITTNATTSVSELSDATDQVRGEYTTDAALEPHELIYDPRDTRAILTIEQPDRGAMGESNTEMDVWLPTNIPIDLTVRSSFGTIFLDLSKLNLQSLTVEGGAGTVRVILPENSNMTINISGGAGEIIIQAPDDTSNLIIQRMEIDGGFGAISLELPVTVDYDVQITLGLSSVAISIPDDMEAQITTTTELTPLIDRIEEVEENMWRTSGYDNATNRATITVTGNGTVRVED